jgi:hypothetical protein
MKRSTSLMALSMERQGSSGEKLKYGNLKAEIGRGHQA